MAGNEASGLNNPVVSLGNRVIDHVPVGAKKLAIQTFGVNDKTALVVSILLVGLVLAMLIGRTFIAGNVKRAFAAIILLSAIAGVAARVDAGSVSINKGSCASWGRSISGWSSKQTA